MGVDDWIENRILWKARKHQLPTGRTHVFAGLPSADRDRLKGEAGRVGRPVLAFIGSPELWTVLGTSEITSRHGGSLHTFPPRQLVDVGPRDKPEPCWSAEQVAAWNGGWEYLWLRGRWLRRATVWVPSGGEAFALWNILLMFPRIYRLVEQRHAESSAEADLGGMWRVRDS